MHVLVNSWASTYKIECLMTNKKYYMYIIFTTYTCVNTVPYSVVLDRSVKSSDDNKDTFLCRNWPPSHCQTWEVRGGIYSAQSHCRGRSPYTWYRWGGWSSPRFSSTRPAKTSVDPLVPVSSHWHQSSGPLCDKMSVFLAFLLSFYKQQVNAIFLHCIRHFFMSYIDAQFWYIN